MTAELVVRAAILAAFRPDIRSYRRKGVKVYGRKGSRHENTCGMTTGGAHRCTLEGCRGVRLAVRWPDDGRMTFPCTKGLDYDEATDSYRIS